MPEIDSTSLVSGTAAVRVIRRLVACVTAAAIAASVLLLLSDGAPRSARLLGHSLLSAAPLLLVGTAYIALQPAVRPTPLELLKRLILGAAFILWGIDQLLRPGWIATSIGDVVISLYVIDLGLVIRDHLRTEDAASWNNL